MVDYIHMYIYRVELSIHSLSQLLFSQDLMYRISFESLLHLDWTSIQCRIVDQNPKSTDDNITWANINFIVLREGERRLKDYVLKYWEYFPIIIWFLITVKYFEAQFQLTTCQDYIYLSCALSTYMYQLTTSILTQHVVRAYSKWLFKSPVYNVQVMQWPGLMGFRIYK